MTNTGHFFKDYRNTDIRFYRYMVLHLSVNTLNRKSVKGYLSGKKP